MEKINLQSFFNIITSNASLKDDYERLRLINYLWIIFYGLLSAFVFIIVNIITGKYPLIIADLIFLLGLITCVFYIYKNYNPFIFYNLSSIIFTCLLIFLIYTQDNNGTRILWCFVYPIANIFVFGNKVGVFWSIFLIIIVNILILFLENIYYNFTFIVLFTFIYLAITGIIALMEHHKHSYYLNLINKQALLEKEIKEKNKLEEELIKLSQTDSLTGLLNQKHFWEFSQKEIERAIRYNTSICMAIIDIDFFKKINDTYGHPIGDRILKDLSIHLKKIIRKSDLLGRIGGEEFAFLFLNMDDSQTYKKLEELRLTINKLPFKIDGKNIHITISIGLAKYTKEITSIENLYKKVDSALYIAKNKGRNCIIKYN